MGRAAAARPASPIATSPAAQAHPELAAAAVRFGWSIADFEARAAEIDRRAADRLR